jgi:Fe2+ or Zn2+ uptake regulation protein
MDRKTKQKRLELFEKLCRTRGSPLTIQRRVILEAALDLDDHPTADRVYETVASRASGISRTTVYRTLETLVQLGVISKACHPGSVARYDNRLEAHHHLICERCDRVIDISDERLDALPIPDTSSLGFEVREFKVQFRGVCRRCLRKKEDRL